MNIRSINEVTFRVASNRDAEQVAALIKSVLTEYDLLFSPDTTDSDLKDIESNYFARGGVFEVIEDKYGNLLGTVGLYPIDERTCELRKMYLVPEIRGIGLGKYVLERTVNNARKLGFKSIILETASVLKEAIRLYTGFGFAPVQSNHLSARCDQAYILELSE